MTEDAKFEGIGSFSSLLYIMIFSILLVGFSSFLSEIATLYEPVLAIINTETSNDTSLNNKPIAQSMDLTTIQNEPVEFKLNATDRDQNDTLNFTVVSNPKYGEITFY